MESPLSGPELTLAWWATTHLLYGSYYRDPVSPFPRSDRMENTNEQLIAIDVTADANTPGQLLVHLSDGSVHACAGFVARNFGNGPVHAIALRDEAGHLIDNVEPILTPAMRDKFVALGAEVPDISADVVAIATVASTETSPPTSEAPSDEAPAAIADTATATATTATAVQAHIGHASVLHDIAFKIERGVQVFLHDVMAALERVG